MPLVITKGIAETYPLDKADPSGETTVTIKPATVAEQAQRDELFAKQVRTYRAGSPDAIEIKGDSTFAQRQALEVFLTLVDSNLMFQEQDPKGAAQGDPKPLFAIGRKPNGEPYLNMTRSQFLEAWGKLAQPVADEIHGKVLVKNPSWDPFQGTTA